MVKIYLYPEKKYLKVVPGHLQNQCRRLFFYSRTKDGNILSNSDRIKIFTEDKNVYVLTISSAEKSDEGDYTIKASSSGGVIQLTSNIIVVSSDMRVHVTSSTEAVEGETIVIEGGHLVHGPMTAGIGGESTEEMDATITLVTEQPEAAAEQTIEMTTETITIGSEDADDTEEESEEESEEEESEEDLGEEGKGEAVVTTITEGDDGSHMSVSKTKTIKKSVDGDTTVEVRTVTQKRIVEVVEGDDEEEEGEFSTEEAPVPQLETPLRGCVVNEGETARLQCKISCDVSLQITWYVHTRNARC